LVAEGHCSREKEERPHRCQQDLRLLALRFSSGLLHGLDGDSRTAAHLRYRNLLVRQMVQMKIKISSLLMEAGVSYMALSVFCRRTTVSRHSRSSACSPSSISELVASSSRK
jgi:hypothetical protein